MRGWFIGTSIVVGALLAGLMLTIVFIEQRAFHSDLDSFGWFGFGPLVSSLIALGAAAVLRLRAERLIMVVAISGGLAFWLFPVALFIWFAQYLPD